MTTNWREAASERAQGDFDVLVGTSLDFATQQLDRRGEFFPFAIVLRGDEAEPAIVMANPGGENPERPDSTDVIALLQAQLREEVAELRAVAVISDVLADGQDAVRVSLDHVERTSIVVLQPYASKRLSRKKTYADLVTTSGDHDIWS